VELHLAFELRSPPGTTPHRELYAAMLDICAWADENGFACANFGEHHASTSGYNPSPLVTCAAVAGRTKRIGMRPNVLLAPLYDPIKLAEDSAVLSLVSGGRFSLAIGSGYRAREYALFGRDLDKRWTLLMEAARVLKQAWTGQPFTHRGLEVIIRPVTDPAPKLLLGGGAAVARRAAHIADGYSIPHDTTHWEIYRQECIAIGKPDPGPAMPLGPVFLWVAEDVEAAWKMLTPHILSQIEEYAAFTIEAYGEQAGPYKGDIDAAAIHHNPAYRVMTPTEAVELGHTLGPRGLLLFNPLMGGIAPAEAWKMLELFRTQVLPHLP
jgi:alkanesulfonate monooxygenase SsuD/methylene tetrahydromethanopterin reductase-like flavin-dependent oxidoreductase (luciferase family)